MIHVFYDSANVSLYIDPATTSYVIQIVAGIIIACGAGLGIFWNKICRFFRKKKDSSTGELNMKEEKSASEEKSVITADDLLGDEEKDEK